MVNSKSIVNFPEKGQFFAHDVHGKPRDGARKSSHNDCTPSSNNTSSGGDSDEPSNHALHSTNNCRFLEIDDVQNCPDENAHGRTNIGVENSDAGICVCRVWITSIETVPANP